MENPVFKNPDTNSKPYGFIWSRCFLKALFLAGLLGCILALPGFGAPEQGPHLYSIEIPFQVGGEVKAILPDFSAQAL